MKTATRLLIPCFLVLSACSDEPSRNNDKTQPATPVSTVDSVLVEPDSSGPEPMRLQPRPVVLRLRNKSDVPIVEEAAPMFEDLLAGLLPPPQQFVVQPGRDTVLRGTQGTLLRLPAGCFVDATGQPPRAAVAITLEEFYTTEAIVAAGLHTQAGQRLLETGGMIYWQARSGDKELSVAPGAGASVAFPAAQPRNGMQLFTGVEQDGRMDWQPVEGGTASVGAASQPARYPGGSGALAALFQRHIDPTDVILPGEHKKYTVFLQVSRSGVSSLLRISPTAADGLVAALTQALNNAARWLPAQQMGMPVADTCKHYLDFEWTVQMPALDTVMPGGTVEGATQPAPKTYEPTVQETMQKLEYYMMRNLQTGWVNCDRYFTDPAPRVEFVLNSNPAREDVRVICSRFRMFLSGSADRNGRWSFPQIPFGERLTVVAIRKVNKEISVAFADAVAGQEPPTLRFQPMTAGDIRRRLQALGPR